MKKPIRVLAIAGLGGLLSGVVWGFDIVRYSSCEIDGVDLPSDATCYQYLGHYFSDTTY